MKKHQLWITLTISLSLLLLIGSSFFIPFAEPMGQTGLAQARGTPSPQASTTPEPTATTRTAQPQSTPVPLTQSVLVALQQTLQGIYNDVSPSVVHIRIVKKQTAQFHDFEGLPDMPDIPDFHFFQPPGNGEEFYSEGTGSGFVWDNTGHIVTNNHVVDGADRITVTFWDGTSTEAELVGADPDSDLAVVKVDMSKEYLKPITVVDSSDVRVGQLVIAIGNPFGLEGTMTVGFVSAIGRSLPVETFATGPSYSIPDIIQTDASINPGNSGGVLVNDKGQLIGVPFAIESPVRASVGIGFVIPSVIVQRVVPVLIEEGAYEHPWLGISGTSLTPDLASGMDMSPTQRGALVMEVTPDGPADKAGIRGSDRQITIDGLPVRVGGDIIISFDDRPVRDFDDLIAYLARYTSINQKITITVLRDGEEKDIDVTLGARPGSDEPEEVSRREASDVWLGVEGRTLTGAIAEAMDLSDDQTGVLINQVEGDSPADTAGLRGSYKSARIDGESIVIGGDIITQVDNEDIETVEELQRVLAGKSAGDRVRLTIIRDGEESTVRITLEKRP